MSAMETSPVDGWDAVEDPWNFGKLKSEDRRSTILIKKISLADGGSAYRVVLYHAPNAHDAAGDYIAEQMVEYEDNFPLAIAELEAELEGVPA